MLCTLAAVRRSAALAVLACPYALTPSVAGQSSCDGEWLPGPAIVDLNDAVRSIVRWDPDGPGPADTVLAVGGDFTTAGGMPANRIAVWDGEEWSTLGSGFDGIVRALVALPSGELVAGGQFTTADGQPAPALARWTGEAWTAMQAGLAARYIWTLAARPNGEVFAAGAFVDAQGDSHPLAYWEGTTWTHISQGVSGRIEALAVLPNGDLVAGGTFRVNQIDTYSIARWDGLEWSRLSDEWLRPVTALVAFPDGRLAVGQSSGVLIRSADGATWTDTWAPLAGTILAFTVLPNGDLVAGGTFTFYTQGEAGRGVARWNGNSWSAIGTRFTGGPEAGPNGYVYSLMALPAGGFIAGGSFRKTNDLSDQSTFVLTNNIAHWRGSEWSVVDPQYFAPYTIGLLPEGGIAMAALVASRTDPVRRNRIVRQSGSDVIPLASEISGGVYVLMPIASGALVAGGSFTAIDGVPARSVAQWDGVRWSPLGAGLYANIYEIAEPAFGDLVVAGHFWSDPENLQFGHIARWTGDDWVPLAGGFDGPVYSMLVVGHGQLIAGGSFTMAAGAPANHIARWDGTAWLPMGEGLTGDVFALARLSDGSPLAAGAFSLAGEPTAQSIARWDGASWLPCAPGPTPVHDLAIIHDDRLVATRNGYPQLWDGSAWTPFGITSGGSVRDLLSLPNGDLAAIGTFTTVAGLQSAYFARWVHTPAPQVSGWPAPQSISQGLTSTLIASPVLGFAERADTLSYQWTRNGLPIFNGYGGASPAGGTVSGAHGTLNSTSALTLTISDAQPTDSGEYAVTLTNDCGTASSQTASLIVSPPPCTGDANASAHVDFADILSILEHWGATYAPDAPETTGDANADRIVNFADFTAALTNFGRVCP